MYHKVVVFAGLPCIIGVYPMHPLEGPRRRVKRAHADTVLLQNALTVGGNASPYGLVEDSDSESVYTHLRLKVGQPPNLDWGISIGGILHNLRAALDGVTWTVARMTTTCPSKPQFPIFIRKSMPKGNSCFDVDGKFKHLDGVDIGHVDLFEREQPYYGTNGGRADFLWMLHQLNNTDKHKVVLVTEPTVHEVAFCAHEVPAPQDGILVHVAVGQRPVEGMKVLSISREAFPDGVDFELKMVFAVAFDDSGGPAAQKPVLPTLVGMCDRVSKIIDKFAPLFPS